MTEASQSSYVQRMRDLRARTPTPQREQARRAATAMRGVIDRLVATKAPAEVLAAAAEQLEAVLALVDAYPTAGMFDGDGSFAESANSGDADAFFDRSPFIGLANPLAPPLELEAVDGRVVGRGRFGAAYEGPPGCVHGGYVAAAFDEVLGMAQSLGGQPGMTGTLTVRYRRPTPLREELHFEGELDRVEGRKIFTTGRVLHNGEVTAEAEAIFITVDFARMAELARQHGVDPA